MIIFLGQKSKVRVTPSTWWQRHLRRCWGVEIHLVALLLFIAGWCYCRVQCRVQYVPLWFCLFVGPSVCRTCGLFVMKWLNILSKFFSLPVPVRQTILIKVFIFSCTNTWENDIWVVHIYCCRGLMTGYFQRSSWKILTRCDLCACMCVCVIFAAC